MRESEQINADLQKIYEEKISDLKFAFNENIEGLSCPLIPHIFEDYVNAKNKILFLGKETHSWGKLIAYKQIPIIDWVNILKGWYLNFDFAKDVENNKWAFNSAFWRFCHEVYSRLNDSILEKCEIKDYSRGFVWLNQSRLDENKTTPSKENFAKILKWSYELLRQEIEILKPDTIILIGNNHYWNNVKFLFEDTFKVSLAHTPIGNTEYLHSVNTIESSFFSKNIKVFWVRHPERKSNEEVFEMVAKIIEFS